MVNAQAVVDAQQNLIDAIQTTAQVYKTADEVIEAVNQMIIVTPNLGVLGFIMAFAKLFEKLFAAKKLKKQLDDIEA